MLTESHPCGDYGLPTFDLGISCRVDFI